jgi:cytidylate kinase
MAAITISRQTGSYGRTIAEAVARNLHLHLADKNTIGTVFNAYCGGEFGVLGGYVPDLWNQFETQVSERRQRMVEELNYVIYAIAHSGNVLILGRSSFAALAGFADVLHVRIQAPLATRIQRVIDRNPGTDFKSAEAIVLESDRKRGAFVELFYGKQWDAPNLFDVVIDTEKIPMDLAIRWISEAAELLRKRVVGTARTVAGIQVDPMLAAIIADPSLKLWKRAVASAPAVHAAPVTHP